MPKVSKETASNVANVGPMENRSEQLGDFLVEAGTEGVEFSGAAEYQQTLEVLERNLAALQAS